MKCPKCGSELRPSKKEPEYGLCDNCKKKFHLKSERKPRKIWKVFVTIIIVLLILGGGAFIFLLGYTDGDLTEVKRVAQSIISSDVEVTFPASFVEDADMSEVEKSAKKEGVKKITTNSDGSVTYVMSKSTHKKLLNELKKSADESIDEMLSDGSVPSIVSISYNDDVTQFDVKVDAGSYTGLESLVVLPCYVYGNLYQIVNGVPEGEIKTIVNFVDNETGEIIDSGDSTSIGDDVS